MIRDAWFSASLPMTIMGTLPSSSFRWRRGPRIRAIPLPCAVMPLSWEMFPKLRFLAPLALAAASTATVGASDLKVLAHYPIGGDVRYDYLRVDPDMRRLYVSHA